MKSCVFFILLGSVNCLKAQSPFTISRETPAIDQLSDVIETKDHLYFIQNRATDNYPPFHTEIYSDILVTTKEGDIINEFQLGEEGMYYQRFYQEGNGIFLLGIRTTSECNAVIVLSKFDEQTHEISNTIELPQCDEEVYYVRMLKGLPGHTFFEVGYGSSWPFYNKRYFLLNEDPDSTRIVADEVATMETLSIDFSGKGYVIGSPGLYNFYTRDFKFRKQRYSNDFHAWSFMNPVTPYGEHHLLEYSFNDNSLDDDWGLQLRQVDSTLKVLKKTVILPGPELFNDMNFRGTMFMPYLQPADIDTSEIWTSCMFNNSWVYSMDGDFYSIIKFNREMDVTCQLFIGFDTQYLIYGIKSLRDGGAVVYGSRLREGSIRNKGEDIYAFRVSENCEPPVSSSIYDPPIQMISVFPNPGSGQISITTNGLDASQLEIQFVDIKGQVVYSQKDLTSDIYLDHLSTGNYFYRIISDNKIIGASSWVKQ